MTARPPMPYSPMPMPGSCTGERLRMSDHFWSNDNTALNIILDRLLKSKRTCETMLKVFEKRAQIEQEYGERLLKLSQIQLVVDGEDLSSTFTELLESVPTAAEATARAHIDLAQQIHHLLEAPLAGFIKEQKTVRKATMAEIDKIQNLRYMHMDNVKRARNAYLSACANLEELKKHAVDPDSEEMVEMKQKAAAVEQEYKLSVGILDSVTKSWMAEWRASCNVFQELEEKKLTYLGGTLHSYANMISNVYTTDDQSCDRIRAAYDNLDTAADIEAFIRNNGTSMNIPEMPKYTSYEDTEDKPKPTIQMMPRTIREINIPVVDEELRSVNDQLNKLPSIRTNASAMADNDTALPPPKSSSIRTVTPAAPSAAQETRSSIVDPAPTDSSIMVSPIEPSPDKEPSQAPPSSNEKTLSSKEPAAEPVRVSKEKLFQKALPSLPAERISPIERNNTIGSLKMRDRFSYHEQGGDKSELSMSRATSPCVYAFEQQQQQQHASDSISGPHMPTSRPSVQLQPTAELEQRISIMNANTPSMDVDEYEESKRKDKKKHKMFPFLKKKQAEQDERSRFSLSSLRGHKKEHPTSATTSPAHSRQTSPQSPFFPSSGGQHTPSPIDNMNGRFNTMPAKYPPVSDDNASILEYVQAQWSYDAKIDSEITFSKNDVLAVFQKKRDGWWDAQIVHSDNDRNVNARGLVPGNFMASL